MVGIIDILVLTRLNVINKHLNLFISIIIVLFSDILKAIPCKILNTKSMKT